MMGTKHNWPQLAAPQQIATHVWNYPKKDVPFITSASVGALLFILETQYHLGLQGHYVGYS